jgi:hypothetical protein
MAGYVKEEAHTAPFGQAALLTKSLLASLHAILYTCTVFKHGAGLVLTLLIAKPSMVFCM